MRTPPNMTGSDKDDRGDGLAGAPCSRSVCSSGPEPRVNQDHFWFGAVASKSRSRTFGARICVLRVRRHHSKPPSLVALQTVLAHHPCNALVIDWTALRLADLRRHPTPAISSSLFALRVPNLLDQLFVLQRALRGRALVLLMESAAQHRQQLAHHRRRIDLSMLFNPRVLHIDSLAKYAAAFFNISFSSFSFVFSCLKRLSSASSSLTGCAGIRFTNSWPLRAR